MIFGITRMTARALAPSAFLLLPLSLTAACSHQQPEVQAPPAVAATRSPAPPRSAPATPPPEAPPARTERTDTGDKDGAIFFDFDAYTLREDSRQVLQRVATKLKGKSQASLRVEGNCDALGTTEYNLA